MFVDRDTACTTADTLDNQHSAAKANIPYGKKKLQGWEQTDFSHPQADGEVRRRDGANAYPFQRDDATWRLVLVLRGNEVVQDSIVEDEPVPLPLAHVP